MKKYCQYFFVIICVIILSVMVGCGRVTKTNYSEGEFVGVWMSEDELAKAQQLSFNEQENFKSRVSCLIITDSFFLYSDPIIGNSSFCPYRISNDAIIELEYSPEQHMSGKAKSEHKAFDIIKVNDAYQLKNTSGTVYMKVCSDPYESNFSKFNNYK